MWAQQHTTEDTLPDAQPQPVTTAPVERTTPSTGDASAVKTRALCCSPPVGTHGTMLPMSLSLIA
jgi:hypothetical protein